MAEQLRVGIIGGGLAAQALHVPALNSLAGRFRITALSDVDPGVCTEVARRCGARAVADPFALAEDPEVDVVLVAAPDSFHVDFAVAACEAKRRAVLVEKPLSLNARMGRAVADASERSGVPVLVNYPHVYDLATERAYAAWQTSGRFRFAEFHCVVGRNDLFIGDVLETIRPQQPDRWPGILQQLDYAATCVEALGAQVDAPTVVGRGLLMALTIHDIPLARCFAGEPRRCRTAPRCCASTVSRRAADPERARSAAVWPDRPAKRADRLAAAAINVVSPVCRGPSRRMLLPRSRWRAGARARPSVGCTPYTPFSAKMRNRAWWLSGWLKGGSR